MPLERGDHEEADQDDQVVQRPDPQDAADPERAERDAAVAGLLAEQERRDQVAAQDEEELDAVSAVLAEARERPAADDLGHDRPGHASVEQVDHHEGDEPQAVELGEVDALGGLGRRRAVRPAGSRPGSFMGARAAGSGEAGAAACGDRPRPDTRDQPLGQVVAGFERFGLVPGPDQVDRVPPCRSVWRSLATVRSARLSGKRLRARRISSSRLARDSSLNPTR